MTETHYKIKGCPVSLALLTDTHDTDPGPLLASLRSRRPSLIALAGDFIRGNAPRPNDRAEDSRNAMELLAGCAGLAPTFVSLGNHESHLSPADLDTIRSTGVTLLENTYAVRAVGGRRIVVGGLSSGCYTRRRRTGALSLGTHPKTCERPEPETGWLKEYIAAEGYHILLMHHPEYIRLIPQAVELVLSGHAHGGQWQFYDMRTKRWRGVYAPDQGLFPKLTDGVVDGRLVISRGLGSSVAMPRLHNSTEIVYIEGI